MKKILFGIIFSITIISFCSNVVAQDINLLVEDFSLAIQSEDDGKSFSLETTLPDVNLSYQRKNSTMKKIIKIGAYVLGFVVGGWLGTVAGVMLAVGIIGDDDENVLPGLLIGSLLAVTGCICGILLVDSIFKKKKKSSSYSQTALINFRNGKTIFGFPVIYFQSIRLADMKKSDLKLSVSLVNLKF